MRGLGRWHGFVGDVARPAAACGKSAEISWNQGGEGAMTSRFAVLPVLLAGRRSPRQALPRGTW
jgi:hypothetical protein